MDAGARDPSIALVSIRWERVQLILEARIAAGTEIDPARLALVPLGGGEAMPPTRTTVDGDRLTARFNVMVGPGLAPLAVGRWTLRSQVALDDPAAADPATASGVFPLTTGLYTVAPAFTPTPGSGDGRGTLAFDVAYDEDVRRDDAAPGQADPATDLHQGQASDLQPPRVGLEAARRARPPAGAVHVPAHLGDVGQPPGRPRPDGRARARPRLRPADHAQARDHRALGVPRPLPPGQRARPGRRDPARRLVPAAQLGRAAPGRPDHPAVARVGRVQDRRLQPRGQARRPQSVQPDPQELHRRDRQLRVRRAVLRRGVRDPRGARRADRDPADGPLLRRGGAGGRRRGGTRRVPRDRRPRDDPVRADLPRRDDPRRLLRLRAPRLRRAPRAVRRARRGGDHQDAPVRAASRWRSPRHSATGCSTDPPPGSTSTTCCSRSTWSSPTIPRSCSSTRPSAARCCSSPTTSTSTSPRATSTCRSSRSSRAGSCGRSRSCSMRSGARTTRARRSPRSPTRHFAHLDGGSTDRVIDELILAP